MNEVGIQASQVGDGATALRLYDCAHAAARPKFRHKISMNAALAHYRMKDGKKSLEYLQRSEKELGTATEKMLALREAINKAMQAKDAKNSRLR